MKRLSGYIGFKALKQYYIVGTGVMMCKCFGILGNFAENGL